MFSELVEKSRTVRSFDETRPVTAEDLYKIIDCARMVPCARNAQPLKYRLVTGRDECSKLVGMTRWAAALPELGLPGEGHYPTAFIAVCVDTEIMPENGMWVRFDAGIASQTIMLKAAEMGYGACILGSFPPEALKSELSLGDRFAPVVLIALGVPAEKAELCEIGEDGSISYFRNGDGIHCVPKRSVEELIIK